MAEQSLFGLEELPADRSIIVVSDLHLGSNEDPGTAERFVSFLDFLSDGFLKKSVVCTNCPANEGSQSSPSGKRLLPPEKIILLGDVMDLWDSRHGDRNNSMMDFLLPLLRLRDMDCDIVYVTGNHDEDVGEYLLSHVQDRKCTPDPENCESGKDTDPCTNPSFGNTFRDNLLREFCRYASRFEVLTVRDEKGKPKREGLKFRWNALRTFELCPRHYPSSKAKKTSEKDPARGDGASGVIAGGRSYAFIHGQQFDPEQITATISEVAGRRFDMVDFVQDLANISVSKQVSNGGLISLFILFIILTVMNFSISSAIPYAGSLIGICLSVYFLYGAYALGIKNRNLPSAFSLGIVSLILGLVFSGAVAAGLSMGITNPDQHYLGILFTIGFLASTFLFVVIVIPRLFALVKRKIYSLYSVRADPHKIISESRYSAAKYNYKAKVLVFGHTHYSDFIRTPESKKEPDPGGACLLVNTGSWVREEKKEDPTDCDTFAYIDRHGICLMRWVYEISGKGRIECLYRKPDTQYGKEIALCSYIRDENLDQQLMA